MKKLNESNLYLRILKFGENHYKGFTYSEIQKSLKLKEWEDIILKQYILNAIDNSEFSFKSSGDFKETIFFVTKLDKGVTGGYSNTDYIEKSVFIIKYDAYFNYIDYLELQKAIENSNEANNHAKNAKRLAIISIWIAILTGIFQINLSESSFWNFICNLF